MPLHEYSPGSLQIPMRAKNSRRDEPAPGADKVGGMLGAVGSTGKISGIRALRSVGLSATGDFLQPLQCFHYLLIRFDFHNEGHPLHRRIRQQRKAAAG